MNDDSRGLVIGCIGMVALFLVMLLLTTSGACNVSQGDLSRLMLQEGISQWQDRGPVYFSCGGAGTFGSHFAGVKNGVPVKGVVCGGWLKNYTIRYE